MRAKWKDLTDAEKCARLSAGRRKLTRAEVIRLDEIMAEEAQQERYREMMPPRFLDLSGNCEAREIQ